MAGEVERMISASAGTHDSKSDQNSSFKFFPGELYEEYGQAVIRAQATIKEWLLSMILPVALNVGMIVWLSILGAPITGQQIVFGWSLFMMALTFSFTIPSSYFDLCIGASMLKLEKDTNCVRPLNEELAMDGRRDGIHTAAVTRFYRWFPALCIVVVLGYLALGVAFLVFLGKIVSHCRGLIMRTLGLQIVFGGTLFITAVSLSLMIKVDTNCIKPLTRDQTMDEIRDGIHTAAVYSTHFYRWFRALSTSIVLGYLAIGVAVLVFSGKIVPYCRGQDSPPSSPGGTLGLQIVFGGTLFITAVSLSLMMIKVDTNCIRPLTRDQMMDEIRDAIHTAAVYSTHFYRWFRALCTFIVLGYLAIGVAVLVFSGKIVPYCRGQDSPLSSPGLERLCKCF